MLACVTWLIMLQLAFVPDMYIRVFWFNVLSLVHCVVAFKGITHVMFFPV